jgi:hypothetical protein
MRTSSQRSAGQSVSLTPRMGGCSRRSARLGGCRSTPHGGSSFNDALSFEPDGAQLAEDEAALLRVPAASRAVMSRLMRQRRAVHERTHDCTHGCQRETGVAGARDQSTGAVSRGAASTLTLQTSVESLSSESSGASLGHKYDSDMSQGRCSRQRRGAYTRSASHKQLRGSRRGGAAVWPPIDLVDAVPLPHANITSPFFTADGTGFSGALDEPLIGSIR